MKKLENISDDEAQEILEEKNYVAALGICAQGIGRGKPNTVVTSRDSCSVSRLYNIDEIAFEG